MSQILKVIKTDPNRISPVDILEKAITPTLSMLMKETLEKPQSDLSLVVRFDVRSKVLRVLRSEVESPCYFVGMTTGEIEDAQSNPIKSSDYDFTQSQKHAIREIRAIYLRCFSQLEDSLFSSSLEFFIKRGMMRGGRIRSDFQVPLPQGLYRSSTL